MNCCTLTVFFEDPFWVGLCEREEAGSIRVCRIVFGAEPKDAEVHDFLLRRWNSLRFSPAAAAAPSVSFIKNPKRRQRDVRRQLEKAPVGTKAQQALALQREAGKEAARLARRERKQRREEEQFALRQQKRKEKHRGH